MGPDFHPFCVFLPPWGYESPAQVELTSQPHVKLWGSGQEDARAAWIL